MLHVFELRRIKNGKKQLGWGMFHHDNLISGTQNSEYSAVGNWGKLAILQGQPPNLTP